MRRMPMGAEIELKGVHFRVWAPKCNTVAVLIEKKSYPLLSENNGYFSGLIEEASEGTLYQFILDDKGPFPDPASRFQPEGPHGPSQVINPEFLWEDEEWQGVVDKDKVILYEIHIGTFTEEGTWQSAIEKLQYLKDLGINVIQMMPITEFPGHFNWGYDGVDLFAPTRNYGHPNDLRHFINAAHKIGLGVILDVVYNHLGPDGNYLSEFSDYYFKQEETEWGQALNFDGEENEETRKFFIENAGYWIEEFHFDGLRFDACHSILDTSSPHILLEINRKVREKGGKKATYITAENEKQQCYFVLSEELGGLGFDAIYNEDFHHSAFVRLTKRREAYFTDYNGNAPELVSSIKHNLLYQGQWYSWQKQKRGTPAIGIKATHFINFLENHDQIANTGNALRLPQLTHPKEYRAMTTLFLLAPQIPLLFQGQEFGSSAPFYYFCEHERELAKKIYKGRLEFILQFTRLNHPDVLNKIPNPNDKLTFLKSKLKWEELNQTSIYELHKDLLSLRTIDEVFKQLPHLHIEGSTLNENILILRYFGEKDERLLLINFDIDISIFPASDPLLAPPEGCHWKILFSSEKPEYGGFGYDKISEKETWKITGSSAAIYYPTKE